MPLFGRSQPAEPVYDNRTTTTTEPRRSSGLFGSKHTEPAPVATTTEPRRSSGMFGRTHRDSSSSRSRSVSPRRRGTGLLSRHNQSGDPSIRAAHERVLTAEAAEREADKALMHARSMVRDARDHVKRLEREAAEDARLAKLKQKESAAISKRAGRLGGLH